MSKRGWLGAVSTHPCPSPGTSIREGVSRRASQSKYQILLQNAMCCYFSPKSRFDIKFSLSSESETDTAAENSEMDLVP